MEYFKLFINKMPKKFFGTADWKTQTLALKSLMREKGLGNRERDLDEWFPICAGCVDRHLTACMFFSAHTNCAPTPHQVLEGALSIVCMESLWTQLFDRATNVSGASFHVAQGFMFTFASDISDLHTPLHFGDLVLTMSEDCRSAHCTPCSSLHPCATCISDASGQSGFCCESCGTCQRLGRRLWWVSKLIRVFCA